MLIEVLMFYLLANLLYKRLIFAKENKSSMNNKDIEERQKILDEGWHREQYFINGHPVSYEEYWDYKEEQRLADAMLDAELSFYSRCTSTGEEWEIDCDGEYTPEEFWDK